MKTLRLSLYYSSFCLSLLLLAGVIGCQPETTVGSDCDTSKSNCKPTSLPLSQIKNVDILFVVDTSDSMASKKDAIGNLVNVLITGDRDGDGTAELKPAESIHLGVISTDMGLPGLSDDRNPDKSGSCRGVGNDGLLQHGSSDVPGCDRDFPLFVTYNAGVDNPEQTAKDYYCMLNLGTAGCGFEMPLEASLKALWSSSDDSISFLGVDGESTATGHGTTENAGFLRDDSLLAIVVVTDEDDCSTDDIDIFGNDYSGSRKDLNLRCYKYDDKLYSLKRYADNFKALRPDAENNIIFAVIGGVPPRLVDKDSDLPQHLLGYVDKDPAQVEAYYSSILSDPSMQKITTQTGDDLEYSCSSVDPSSGIVLKSALPPRRLVELAKQFGANGVVQSICEDGFNASLQTVTLAITNRMIDVAAQAAASR
jgi:hypothetical protein